MGEPSEYDQKALSLIGSGPSLSVLYAIEEQADCLVSSRFLSVSAGSFQDYVADP